MKPSYKIDLQLILYILFTISFLILIPVFVDHHRKTVALEKRLIEIEKEINLREVNYIKKIKEFEQQELKQKKQIEKYKSDLHIK